MPHKPSITVLPEKGRMGIRHDQRDTNVTSIVADLIPSLGLRGRILVVDDDTDVITDAMRRLGLNVIAWHRRAMGGHTARPWIDTNSLEAAFIRYPVSRNAFEMLVHAVAPRLTPNGRLFTYGANDEGIKSSNKALAVAFQNVEVVETKRHSRVMLAKRVRDIAFKKELEDWKETVTFETPQGNLSLVSYPCLFAHGHLDGGTKLLLQALPSIPKEQARVLDYGCGIGIIGLVLQRTNPSIEADLIDIDAIAIHATMENVPRAHVFTADSMEVVRGKKYDLIVSNPPIHAGKGEDFTVLIRFLTEAASSLTQNGELLFVVQATVPIQNELTKLFTRVTAVAKNRQYTVWKCSIKVDAGGTHRAGT